MHFNVRATERLVVHGTLTGWFDAQSWYPYGRVVEDTVRVRLRTSTSLHPHSLSNPKPHHTLSLSCCVMQPTVSHSLSPTLRRHRSHGD